MSDEKKQDGSEKCKHPRNAIYRRTDDGHIYCGDCGMDINEIFTVGYDEEWDLEPWSVHRVVGEDFYYLTDMKGRAFTEIGFTTKANMDRIAACVSACAGVPTERLLEVANDPKLKLITLRDVGKLKPRFRHEEDPNYIQAINTDAFEDFIRDHPPKIVSEGEHRERAGGSKMRLSPIAAAIYGAVLVLMIMITAFSCTGQTLTDGPSAINPLTAELEQAHGIIDNLVSFNNLLIKDLEECEDER